MRNFAAELVADGGSEPYIPEFRDSLELGVGAEWNNMKLRPSLSTRIGEFPQHRMVAVTTVLPHNVPTFVVPEGQRPAVPTAVLRSQIQQSVRDGSQQIATAELNRGSVFGMSQQQQPLVSEPTCEPCPSMS